MSDIKDIVPEADWTKYNIQNEPIAPTSRNVVTAEYLNGMSKAIKTNELETRKNQTNLSLNAPWTTSSTWSTPIAYVFGGFVYLEGYVTDGSTGRNNKICTLPSGYKPPKYMKFLVAPNTVVQLDLNGDVWVETGSTNNVFLNGIVFKR